jgi:hypothetical protein
MLTIALGVWISLTVNVRTGMWIESVPADEPRYALPYQHVKRLVRV